MLKWQMSIRFFNHWRVRTIQGTTQSSLVGFLTMPLVSIIWIGYVGHQDFYARTVHVARAGAWVMDVGAAKHASVEFPLHLALSSTTHKRPSPFGSLRLGI
jgi:hypothetical protein